MASSSPRKCGFVRDPANPGKREINNRPEYIKASCEGSLRRLGVETIDLYYLHRYYPPSASIDEAVGAMADLVRDGKVRALGLSEVSATTLAKACAVHPISALQTEYSLWSREPEHNGVLRSLPRSRRHLRPVQPARPRLPERRDQAARGFRP